MGKRKLQPPKAGDGGTSQALLNIYANLFQSIVHNQLINAMKADTVGGLYQDFGETNGHIVSASRSFKKVTSS